MVMKIPIDGDVEALRKKIQDIGREIDKINKKPIKPINVNEIQSDFDKVSREWDRTRNRVIKTPPGGEGGGGGGSGSEGGSGGSSGGGGSGGGQRPDDRVRYSVRRRYTYAPELRDIPQAAISGFGGGLSQVAGSATRGAIAGTAEGGGLAGGLMGLLRGAGIGAAVYGAFKVGQAASEGMDMARDRDTTLDTLKRQMGDVGVAFDRLRASSEAASYALGINSKDYAALEQQMNVASRGADKNPLELGEATGVAAGFARSYGIDPGRAVSLFGGERNIDQRQNYRQFATILAETIEKSNMSSRADEVMQAVLSFSTLASRLSLSTPNVGAYGAAYAGMVGSGITGLTPEVSQQILSQANNATAQMGAAGEAGQAFMFQALQRSGKYLNPLATTVEASGGLFGSRSSVFGAGSAVEAFMGKDYAARMRAGGDPTMTNFDMVARQLRAVNGNSDTGKLFQAESAQRLFGLQSIDQAMALLSVSNNGGMGKLSGLAASTGTDLNKVNYTNIQTLAKISGATDAKGLDAIFDDMKTRTGTSALSQPERDRIQEAKDSGNMDDYRSTLFTTAAKKDQAQDVATTARDTKAVLDNIQITIGEKLYGAVTDVKDTMITLWGGHKALDEGRKADAEYMYKQSLEGYSSERQSLYAHPAPYGEMSAKDKERIRENVEEESWERTMHDNPSALGGVHAYGNHKKMTMPSSGMLPEVTVTVHNSFNVDKSGNVSNAAPTRKQISTPQGSGTSATVN